MVDEQQVGTPAEIIYRFINDADEAWVVTNSFYFEADEEADPEEDGVNMAAEADDIVALILDGFNNPEEEEFGAVLNTFTYNHVDEVDPAEYVLCAEKDDAVVHIEVDQLQIVSDMVHGVDCPDQFEVLHETLFEG